MDAIHASAGELTPVNPPVGVYTGPFYCRAKPTVLILKEQAFSLSGDSFHIKDSISGESLFQCDGKAFSLHDRKHILDPNGKIIYNIGEKLISLHKTFVAEDENGREILRVKKHHSIGSKLTAHFQQQGGHEREIELTGDFWGGSAHIKLVPEGTLLANVHRGVVNAGELFADKQTYFVSVAPGVDISLMAALCICFDEAKNED